MDFKQPEKANSGCRFSRIPALVLLWATAIEICQMKTAINVNLYGIGIKTMFSLPDKELTMLTGKFKVRRIVNSATLFCALAFTSSYAIGSGSSGAVDVAAYHLGKEVFHEKVVCESCAYASLVLETEIVAAVWDEMKKELKRDGNIGKDLSIRERNAVEKYVKKRFAL